ncbi:MAG: acyltransferase [Dysgonomonas sp.]
MTLDELQSKVIDYIRFPLAVGIVWIHTAGAINVDTIQQIDLNVVTGDKVYAILTIIFAKLIFLAAVPLFFIISGYYYFYNVKSWGRGEYVRKTKSRLKSLVIPYFIWNAIAFSIAVAQGLFIYYSKGETGSIMSQLGSVDGWLKPFWNQWQYGPIQNILGTEYYITFPYIGALWFLRDLITISLLSPVIYLFVKYTKIWGLVLLFIALYTNIWIHIPGFGIEVFFYFSLGAYLGVSKKNMLQLARKVKIPALVLCLLALFFAAYGTPSFFPFVVPIRLSILIFVITMCITSLNIVAALIENKKIEINNFLSKTTFFIFAAHGLVLSALNIAFRYVFSSDTIFVKVSQFIISPIVVVIVCILGYYILHKITPRLLSILVGSR